MRVLIPHRNPIADPISSGKIQFKTLIHQKRSGKTDISDNQFAGVSCTRIKEQSYLRKAESYCMSCFDTA